MTITRFEDLLAWQKARSLTTEVYQVTRSATFRHNRGLASQLQRASVSIMSNIAEGFERSNQGDYHRFLVMAKGSCGEILSQLYVALDVGYLNQTEFERLSQQTSEVGRIIGGLVQAVEARRLSATPPR